MSPRLWYISHVYDSPWAMAFRDIVRELIMEATCEADRADCYRALMDLWWFLTPTEREGVKAEEIRWYGPDRAPHPRDGLGPIFVVIL